MCEYEEDWDSGVSRKAKNLPQSPTEVTKNMDVVFPETEHFKTAYPKVVLDSAKDSLQKSEEKDIETILDEASKVAGGQREHWYGHPKINCERIADGWRWYLRSKYGIEVPINPEDTQMMMIIVKLAREMHKPNRDSLVDICGYARCVERTRAKDGLDGYAK